LPAALALLPAQASEARPAAQALGCVTARKRLTNEAADLLSGNGATDERLADGAVSHFAAD